MDINEIWVLDVSEMNNRRFNAKRGVVSLRNAYINLACVINPFTSPISVPCPFKLVFNPSKLLYKMKVVELTKPCNFFAISIIMYRFLIIFPNAMISFFPYIITWRSTLENPFLSPTNSNWAIKPQYEKLRKSCNTFIHCAEPNYHNTGPSIELKHDYAQLRCLLCSLSKLAITFSTQLGMKWFERNLNDNSRIYLHIRNHNLLISQTVPV